MDNLQELLSQLDLGRTEQLLYLNGLNYAEISVKQLVENTELNRTTAYHALGTLKQKGFTREVKRQGVLYYRMTPHAELSNLLEAKQARLEAQKHSLQSLGHLFPATTPSQAQTDADIFEGPDNIKLAIEKALYCTSRKWDIIAPKDNFFSQIDKQYARHFMATRKSRGIQARTLWESVDAQKSSLSLEDTLMRRPRYLDASHTGKFTSVVIIFDTSILFIPPLHEQRAVIVHSVEVHSTLSVMFDALWQSAK